ncbi:PREDICTED: zinc finger MYM-type protein 5-like [Erythranthe guttata]|uniref:zinc finger MYM-type protein 5-like n=1 Tax=Erythranthe guttata TaxID=4155 RepID=UPI00064DDF00|nr:PREDICTED: zinc finger MYM-type protein 5-like [Erythranthe guttata]|eukprot:XP_012848043.1 PREDICTED: zinc finger MYM-type protein 5-like [Erythranthe guttata]
MGPRKFECGDAKRKKKQRIEECTNSQKDDIFKFFPHINRVQDEVVVEDEVVAEDEVNLEEVHENEVDNEQKIQTDNIEIGDASGLPFEEAKEDTEQLNIDDPVNWIKLDQKMKDLIEERGPIRAADINFEYPLDDQGRHFSSVHYTQQLTNGEKQERKWLVYSKLGDKIFCFCCKLFKQDGVKVQLATEGFNAWKNISSRLKGHECSNDHIICMSRWIQTETRMRKRETIDKSLQEKMNREKDY